MKLFIQNTKSLTIAAVALLLLFNYSTVAFGLDADFFGILFSTLLFFIGGRTTDLKVNYLLLGFIFILEFISFRLHTKSLHFLSLMLLVCFVYYHFTRRFSFIAFICILLFSTVFNKFFEHLSVEIKQFLCDHVFLLLRHFREIEKADGVNFYINGAKISIDTACMGLSMFKTGLLTGAILLTFEELKQRKYFSILQIICFCLVIVFLNVVSNYFRIITLILLNCTQENTLHHAVGLVCFVLYQVIPMLFLIRFLTPKQIQVVAVSGKKNWLVLTVAFTVILITSFEMKKEQKFDLLSNLNPKYEIEKGEWVNAEVFKIQYPEKLIYIKTPSHKPLICWTGTGYKITESKEIFDGKEKIWYTKMEKDGVEYQSLWWYECDGKKYTSFIEVMLIQLAYGKSIRLINETSVFE